MKIIKEKNKKQLFPMRISCEHCDSELEIEQEDLSYDFSFRKYEDDIEYPYITCPVCNQKQRIKCDEIQFKTTYDNLEYPNHFRSSVNGINIEDDEIVRYIRRGIDHLHRYPENCFYYIESGNTFICIFNNINENNYYVIVCKNFDYGWISYTSEDYCT